MFHVCLRLIKYWKRPEIYGKIKEKYLSKFSKKCLRRSSQKCLRKSWKKHLRRSWEKHQFFIKIRLAIVILNTTVVYEPHFPRPRSSASYGGAIDELSSAKISAPCLIGSQGMCKVCNAFKFILLTCWVRLKLYGNGAKTVHLSDSITFRQNSIVRYSIIHKNIEILCIYIIIEI